MAIEWKPLVICGKTPGDGVLPAHTAECGYDHLIQTAQNLITDLFFVSTLIATAAFIYVGFKLMTAGGNASAGKEAKDMLWKVVWGFFWILAAWIVVYTITSAILKPEFNNILGRPTTP